MNPTAIDSHQIHYRINAKHTGEAVAFDIARGEFVCLLGNDSRTARRFDLWAKLSGADAAISELTAFLDALAQRAGHSDRTMFRVAGVVAIPENHVLEAARLGDRIYRRLEAARMELAADVVQFIRDGLRDGVVPPCMGWLGLDLLSIFKQDFIAATIWGPGAVRFDFEQSVPADEVKKGQRPHHDGSIVRRNIQWVYRSDWAPDSSRVTVRNLAEERRHELKNAGTLLAPKEATVKTRDYDEQRPDTSVVREGLDAGRRLLNELLPHETWVNTFTPIP